MAAHRGERRAPHWPAVGEDQQMGARAGLTEAVAELRRLAQDPFLQSVAGALPDPGDPPPTSARGLRPCVRSGAGAPSTCG